MMTPVVNLMCDSDADPIQLYFPTHVTPYNIATLAKLRQPGLALKRIGSAAFADWPHLTFNGTVAIIPPAWLSDAAVSDMINGRFHVQALGEAIVLPSDPSQRRDAIGRANAAKQRLVKDLKSQLSSGLAKRLRNEVPPRGSALQPTTATVSIIKDTAATTAEDYILCPACGVSVPSQNSKMHAVICGKGNKPGTATGGTPLPQNRTPSLMPCSNQGCEETFVTAEDRAEHELHGCPRRIVSCPDCSLELAFELINDHRSHHCPSTLVPCTVRGCGVMVERQCLDEHIGQCAWRIVVCRYCDGRLPLSEMAEHEQQCGTRTEPCPECHQRVSRKDAALHVCARKVPCPNDGCRVQLLPSDIMEHCASCEFTCLGCPNGCGEIITRRTLPQHQRVCPKQRANQGMPEPRNASRDGGGKVGNDTASRVHTRSSATQSKVTPSQHHQARPQPPTPVAAGAWGPRGSGSKGQVAAGALGSSRGVGSKGQVAAGALGSSRGSGSKPATTAAAAASVRSSEHSTRLSSHSVQHSVQPSQNDTRPIAKTPSRPVTKDLELARQAEQERARQLEEDELLARALAAEYDSRSSVAWRPPHHPGDDLLVAQRLQEEELRLQQEHDAAYARQLLELDQRNIQSRPRPPQASHRVDSGTTSQSIAPGGRLPSMHDLETFLYRGGRR